MPDLISNTKIDIQSLKKTAAKAVVNSSLAKKIMTKDEAINKLEFLYKKIDSTKDQLTRNPKFKELDTLSSRTLNEFFEYLSIDLATLFALSGNIEAINRQLDSINTLDVSSIKTIIESVNNQKDIYLFLKKYKEYQDYKIVNFVDMVNDDRSSTRAEIDSDTRTLELKMKSSRVIIPGSNLNNTCYVVSHGNVRSSGIADSYFSIDNIIDSNPRTFWYDSFISDAPVEHIYIASWGEYKAAGPVIEIVIKFSNCERFNNIKLIPFSESPYNIIDVCYKDSDNVSWRMIPNFKIRREVDFPIELSFQLIAATEIKFVIEQPNYTKHIDSVPESIVKNNYLYNLYKDISANDPYSEVIATINENTGQGSYVDQKFATYDDFVKYIEKYYKLLEELSPENINELSEFISGKKSFSAESFKTSSYYEYNIGIRNIEITANTYEPLSEYCSKQLVTSGTILVAELEAEEDNHYLLEDGLRYKRTSTEYSLEVSDSKSIDIHPINFIDGEHYRVDDEYVRLVNGTGQLRFDPVDSSFILRENGSRLNFSRFSVLGRSVSVSDYKASAIYTISYKVGRDAVSINLLDLINPVEKPLPDKFNSTDEFNSLTLNNYPFVILEIVKDHTAWTKKANDASWVWNPTSFIISKGTVTLSPNNTLVVLSKNSVSDLGFGSLLMNANTKIWLLDTGETLDINENIAATDLTLRLASPYSGSSISTRFIAGEVKDYYGKSFGLNNTTYSPIEVYINGVKALNKTDYESNTRPAFDSSSNAIEYIHLGKKLYFNKAIDSPIDVYYNYLTSYLKVKASLRCNVGSNTIFTPKINSINVRLITTEL